jgi:hypothetical protein
MFGILCGMMGIFVQSYLPLRTGYYSTPELPSECGWQMLSAEFMHNMGFKDIINSQHVLQGTLPNPVMWCQPSPPKSALPTDHSTPTLARGLGAKQRDWAETKLGADAHGGNAARPWLGTRGPTDPCRPERQNAMQRPTPRRESRAANLGHSRRRASAPDSEA